MTPTLSPGDLAELRRLGEAATGGEWVALKRDKDPGWMIVVSADETKWNKVLVFPILIDLQQQAANAAYIVALVNAAPALLDRLDALETALRRIGYSQESDLAVYARFAADTARALLESR